MKLERIVLESLLAGTRLEESGQLRLSSRGMPQTAVDSCTHVDGSSQLGVRRLPGVRGFADGPATEGGRIEQASKASSLIHADDGEPRRKQTVDALLYCFRGARCCGCLFLVLLCCSLFFSPSFNYSRYC